MKKSPIFLLFCFTNFCLAQNQLRIEIKGFKNNKGFAQVALYDNATQFLKKQRQTATVKIIMFKATVLFENLPNGNYALAVFHDENSNTKMDLGLFGIPKEAYGFSNNAKGFMSAPKFEAAKITIQQDTSIEIKIN
jgi:uncharacterized protein (DUF2141 family)